MKTILTLSRPSWKGTLTLVFILMIPFMELRALPHQPLLTVLTLGMLQSADLTPAAAGDTVTAATSTMTTVWYYTKIIAVLLFYVFAILVIAITLLKKKRFEPLTAEEFKKRRADMAKQESSATDDEAALECLQQAYLACAVISAPGEVETRTPTSMKQIKRMHELVDQAIALNPTRPDIVERLNQVGDAMNIQERRRFSGSWKLIGCALLAMVLFYFSSKSFSEGIFDYLKMTFFIWGGIILYYFASMAPVFLIEKRERGFRRLNIHNLLIGTVVGLFLAEPATETWKITYRSGRTTTEERVNGMWLLWLILTLFVVLVLGTFIFLFAGLNFIRNYLIYF
ncbi:MAG TPA: hypothetical protein PKG48_03925 [Bacteroidales bacterium]|nr:hypothetical protein [Bacteroidales bacterium]